MLFPAHIPNAPAVIFLSLAHRNIRQRYALPPACRSPVNQDAPGISNFGTSGIAFSLLVSRSQCYYLIVDISPKRYHNYFSFLVSCSVKRHE
jgi:hypothetical protein